MAAALRPLVAKALQKVRLNRTAHRVYYSWIHGFRPATPAVLSALTRCLEEVKRVGDDGRGDYYEFGVFKGYALLHAQHEARRLGLGSMRFFGFDSFAGLPPVEGADETADDVFYEGQYACSKDRVVANLTSHGADWSRTVLVEGYFRDSLRPALRREHHMKEVAVALIDCDLHSSTCEVLDFVEPLLREGSLLLFDDYDCFDAADDRGQRLALREFLAAHPRLTTEELFTYGSYGHVFRVGVRDDGSAQAKSGSRP